MLPTTMYSHLGEMAANFARIQLPIEKKFNSLSRHKAKMKCKKYCKKQKSK